MMEKRKKAKGGGLQAEVFSSGSSCEEVVIMNCQTFKGGHLNEGLVFALALDADLHRCKRRQEILELVLQHVGWEVAQVDHFRSLLLRVFLGLANWRRV